MPSDPAPPAPNPPPVRKLPYLLALLLFILADGFADRSIKDHEASWIWLTACVLAAVAMAYGLWRGERDLMQDQDELQQKIRTEALAHAFPFALAVMLLLGKLDEADVALIPARAYWIAAALPYFPILAWCKRRYQ